MLGGPDQDVLAGGAGSDRIDGDLPSVSLAGGVNGNPNGDLIFGDNVSLDRENHLTKYEWDRFQTLNGTALFAANGSPAVTELAQLNPDGQPVWANWIITCWTMTPPRKLSVSAPTYSATTKSRAGRATTHLRSIGQ